MRLLKIAAGWTASNMAWDALKEGVSEAYKAYRETQGLLQDLQQTVDELNRPTIRPRPAPTPPTPEQSEPDATPEPPAAEEETAPSPQLWRGSIPRARNGPCARRSLPHGT